MATQATAGWWKRKGERGQSLIEFAFLFPMVLLFVNDAFESSAFGLPMKFVKQ